MAPARAPPRRGARRKEFFVTTILAPIVRLLPRRRLAIDRFFGPDDDREIQRLTAATDR